MIERLLLLALAVGISVLLAWAWQRWRAYELSRLEARDVAGSVPVVLAFTADRCGQCRLQQRPILRDLQRHHGHLFVVREVDVEQDVELAKRFGVLTLPTTVVVAPSGRVVARNTGVVSAAVLLEQVRWAAAEVDSSFISSNACHSVGR